MVFNFKKVIMNMKKKKEVLFLQEQLKHIKNHNKSIERQVDLFKKHEEDLLEEKEFQQSLLSNAKKRFQNYEMNEVPNTENGLISNLKSILEVAQDLETLIVHSEDSDNKLPSSAFLKDLIQQYLDVEEKLQFVNVYLQNNFQLQDNNALSFIAHENSHRMELIKEASFLQKLLKRSMIDKVQTEKEIHNIESMIKYFEENKTNFTCHPSQLKYKLQDVLKLNEQLKEKENQMKAYALDAGSKHVEALLTEIDMCVTNETFHKLEIYIEKMLLPMNILIDQRARLEILIVLLNEHKKELQVIKDVIQTVLNQMKEEKLNVEERQAVIEDKMAEVGQISEQNPEATVLSSLQKIFDVSGNFEDSTMPEVPDIMERANKLLEAKENCRKEFEEKMKTINLIEFHANALESLLNCTDKAYLNWHELKQKLNVDLNNLDIKLTSLKGNAFDCHQDLDQKQKILERKGNLRLARCLYVYALLNKELFKKCIEDIKIAIENSTGYKS